MKKENDDRSTEVEQAKETEKTEAPKRLRPLAPEYITLSIAGCDSATRAMY